MKAIDIAVGTTIRQSIHSPHGHAVALWKYGTVIYNQCKQDDEMLVVEWNSGDINTINVNDCEMKDKRFDQWAPGEYLTKDDI